MPPLAAHERAGVLSVLYIVSYLGMGLPAVVAGFLVVHGGGLLTTSYEYGFAVMALALAALTVVVRRPALAPALAAPELCTNGAR
jgi:MFS family permease